MRRPRAFGSASKINDFMGMPLDILDEIQKKYRAAVVPRCQETNKQRIDQGRNIRAVVLKPEKLTYHGPRQEPRCDCIVLFYHQHKLCVAIVELKSSTIHFNQIIEQHKNCDQLARRLLSDCGIDQIEYRHFLFSTGGWNVPEKKKIENWNKKKTAPFQIERYGYDPKRDLASLFR